MDQHVASVDEERKDFQTFLRLEPLHFGLWQSFSKKQCVNTHVEPVQGGKKSNKCDICTSAFYHKRGLNRHIESVHEGKKPYLHNNCGIVTSVKEGNKQNKCEISGASFTQKIQLKQNI